MDETKLYRSSYRADKFADQCTETFKSLSLSDDPEDIELVENLQECMDPVIDLIPKLGQLSAIELMGKMGKWMSDNDITGSDINAYYDKSD